MLIWVQSSPGAAWTKTELKADPFGDVVWRISWSPSGNILAVSCGDNRITLWKEGVDGWLQVSDVGEQ